MNVDRMKITNEMQATYNTLYHLEDLLNKGFKCEVTLHRLATRLTSHFKSVYSWYAALDWSTKYDFMACTGCMLKMLKRSEAFERFSDIDDNKEKFDNLWKQVE